ncbi:MAG: tail fiber domain-containing protein [Bacteroidetes bacterium]|nr:tail fiber domain-containing protein [Bacteroidota bacterium]
MKTKILLLTVSSFLTITGISQTITGSGTQYYYPMFGATGTTIGNSSTYEDGSGNVGVAQAFFVAGGITNYSTISCGSGYKWGATNVISGAYNNIYSNSRVIQNTSPTYQDGMYINYASPGTTAAHLRFFANGITERMRIDASTGNVGIGTTAPGAKLEVVGTIKSSSLAGTGTRMVVTGATGILSSQTIPSADNLGNHTATTNLNINSNSITGVGSYINYTNGAYIYPFSTGLYTNNALGIGASAPVGYMLYVNGDGYFNGNVNMAGTWYYSDKRFKKNITSLSSTLEKVLSLKTYSYYFDQQKFPEKNFNDKLQFGVLAQEIKEVFPNLVSEGKDGYYSVNYVEIIPLLITAMKEQQEMIENQNQKISDLENKITSVASTENSDKKLQINTEKGSQLFQNIPNPFSEKTTINYTLSENINTASIIIFDLQGKQIKKYDLQQKGQGNIIIQAGELYAGMFIYSLVIDGKEVSSKKMILNK